MTATDPVVQALLDATFRELQHDTGPNDPEWQHQQRVLSKQFKAILRGRAHDAARAEPLMSGWELTHSPQNSVRAEPVANNSDGDFCDKWGACKVCGGEIPYGHTATCYIWKIEQERDQAIAATPPTVDVAALRRKILRLADQIDGLALTAACTDLANEARDIAALLPTEDK